MLSRSISAPQNSALLEILQEEEGVYFCPGEPHPISRSVHLSRLANCYSKCGDCEYRSAGGNLPIPASSLPDAREVRVGTGLSLFTPTGIRGVFWNELTPQRAGRMAEAVASVLWVAQPRRAQELAEDWPEPESSDTTPPASPVWPMAKSPTGPTIVIGHDGRASSPTVITAVSSSFKRMGCQVLDVGSVSKPCWQFAVSHLQGSAGLYVTGSGSPAAWTGMDLVSPQGVPWSLPGGLTDLATSWERTHPRPTRSSGSYRLFRPGMSYVGGLTKYWHSLRPLKFAFGSGHPLLRGTLASLLEGLPCHATYVSVGEPGSSGVGIVKYPPGSKLNDLNPHQFSPSLMETLVRTVREQQLDFAWAVAEDGQTCVLLDERGRPIDATTLGIRLAEVVEDPRHEIGAVGRSVAVETSYFATVRTRLPAGRYRLLDAGETQESLASLVAEGAAQFGTEPEGRYWFHDAGTSTARCDGLLTLAHLMRLLSRTEQSVSNLGTPS